MSLSPNSIRVHIDSLEPINLRRYEKIMFRNGGEHAFVVSKRYVIEVRFEALTSIPCARINITVEWTSHRRDFHEFDIGPLNVGNISQPFRLEYGVIEPGYGLIFLDGKVSPRESDHDVPFRYRTDLQDAIFYIGENVLPKFSQYGVHIESVFGQNAEEFYQYWAMILAVIGLYIVVLEKLIPFIKFLGNIGSQFINYIISS